MQYILIRVISLALLFRIIRRTTPSHESFHSDMILEQAIHSDCQNQDKIDSGFHCVFDDETRWFKLDGFEPTSLPNRAIRSLSPFGCGRVVIVRFPLHGQHYTFYFVGIFDEWFHVHSKTDDERPMKQLPQYEHARTPTTYKYSASAPSAIQHKTTHSGTLSA